MPLTQSVHVAEGRERVKVIEMRYSGHVGAGEGEGGLYVMCSFEEFAILLLD